MTACDIHRDHQTRAAEWHGWQPSTANPCPLRLAGRHCRWSRGEECLCNRRVLDHARAWTDQAGHRVITAEPYDAAGEEIAALDAELAALGLSLTLSGASPYYPGRTLLMVIRTEVSEP